MMELGFEKLADLSLPERLVQIREQIDGKIVFTSSLGIEDQLITHHIASQKLKIEIITLDTGRLFDQSHDLWQATEDKYDIIIKGFYPNQESVAKLVRTQGTNGFRNSIEARKECCAIRKIEPLNRALIGAKAWITGLRADASSARNDTQFAQFDSSKDLYKFSPLFDYSRQKVLDEVKSLDVPFNTLENQGFVSIGCAPCTRAIKEGEDERAGRWWWENQDNQKECGLHVNEDGALVRIAKN